MINPEFWSDERIGECSTSARLMFIGTWNFADDYGNLDRSPRQLKAQIFPYDNIDCEQLVQELLKQELLSEYEVNGKKYLHINGFEKHQIIDRKSKARCPMPSTQRVLVEDAASTRPKRELKEKKEKKESVTDISLEPFDGDVAFHHLCNIYKKAESSRITQQRYFEAVESIVKDRGCTRTDAAAHLAHKAEIYCSRVEVKFQKGLTSWLEMKIFNQDESAWGNTPKPLVVPMRSPAQEMLRQLESD
jgi:hypothetical protein